MFKVKKKNKNFDIEYQYADIEHKIETLEKRMGAITINIQRQHKDYEDMLIRTLHLKVTLKELENNRGV